MKKLFVLSLLTAALLIGGVEIAQAQTTASQNATAPAAQSNDNAASASNNNHGGTANNVRTLSGCLQQGAGANEYTLFGGDANSWELRSNHVDLAAHVGQAVTVAYVTIPNAKASAGASTPLIVTDLVMVSSNCSW